MSELHEFVLGDKVTLSEEALSERYRGNSWIREAVGLVGFVSSVMEQEHKGAHHQRLGVNWVDEKRDLARYTYHNSWLKYLGSTTE